MFGLSLYRLAPLLFLAALFPSFGVGVSRNARAERPPNRSATLFGRPNDQTGLDGSTCRPSATFHGTEWHQPEYDASDVAALLTWTLTEAPAELAVDPYDAAEAHAENAAEVCAIVRVKTGTKQYRVETFESEDRARAAGAIPTHFGACGLCSSLQDLSVYMRENDLTDPVRRCAFRHLVGSKDEHMQCLVEIGFTRQCASIYYYASTKTRDVCFDECIGSIGQPYNLPDGSLNPCLACDEAKSGPVFKAVAGRTRRNTGLANAICRPSAEVRALVHAYD